MPRGAGRMNKDAEPKSSDSDPILQKLLESRNILVSQEINDESTYKTISQLLLLDSMDPAKEIRVFINSPGGSADGGFAVFDVIRFIQAPVKTIATGLVASAASIIFLGARKENRFAMRHC